MAVTAAFEVLIHTEAEPVRFEELPRNERRALCDGFNYNPETHDLYRFLLSVRLTEKHYEGSVPKKAKASDFNRATDVVFDVRSPSQRIRFAGIFPRDMNDQGQHMLPETEQKPAEIAVRVNSWIEGAIKFPFNFRKRPKLTVKGSRQPSWVQWICLRSYFDDHLDFTPKILCIVDKNLPEPHRFVNAVATVKAKGRHQEPPLRRPIRLPKSATASA